MSACGEWAWFHPERGLQPFLCGSMSCPREKCRKLFWSRRVRLLTALIEEHGLIRFFTLTLDRSIIDIDPWDYIHHVWSKFRKRMRRKFSEFKFAAVLESHKDKNWPHIHGFTNIWLKQKQWSEMWVQSGGGPIVWIEAVDNSSAGAYVSKQLNVARYVGKEQLEGAYKKKKTHRTMWRSEGLKAKFELESCEDWIIIKEGVFQDNEVRTFFRNQFGVNRDGQKKQKGTDLEATHSKVFT